MSLKDLSPTTVPANTPNNNYTDKLEFDSHEEGRIRALYDNTGQPNTNKVFAFAYMLKDHMDDVRILLRDEIQRIYI